jgi:hypothetical protein
MLLLQYNLIFINYVCSDSVSQMSSHSEVLGLRTSIHEFGMEVGMQYNP